MTSKTAQSHTAIVIPARGGSKTIPRKNLRMLQGKPLIAYTIEAAKAAGLADKVYVSTEDREIAEIAARFGAEVLTRDVSLAGDEVPLDPVIEDAVAQIEAAGAPVDYVMTIQATCPLIEPESLREALRKCQDETLDTVLSAVEDRALRWAQKGGELRPDYEARLNRQQLDPVYRETGGVVVCRREVLRSGTRFGERVGLLLLDKREALDIDDFVDWSLAEHFLSQKLILFHVIGHKTVGLGHVYRALTIAERLPQHHVRFIVASDSGLAASVIRDRHFIVDEVDPEDLETRIQAIRPDVLINDILDTSASFMRRMRQSGIRCINFEDLGPGSEHADLVINAMYEAEDSHPAHSLTGAAYDCLRSEFYSIEPRPVHSEVQQVLLLFGGTDPGGLTLRVLDWLNGIPGSFSVCVVLGLGFSGDEDAVKRLAEKSPHPVDVKQDVPVISTLMQQADLAITSGGRTVFELASLGVPMIVLAQNAREMTHAFARTSKGIRFLGRGTEVERTEFIQAFEELIRDREKRGRMSEALLQLDIREGINRVTEVIHRFAISRGMESA